MGLVVAGQDVGTIKAVANGLKKRVARPRSTRARCIWFLSLWWEGVYVGLARMRCGVWGGRVGRVRSEPTLKAGGEVMNNSYWPMCVFVSVLFSSFWFCFVFLYPF